MEYKPHNYQEYAKRFIETHRESAVLLDMGLGKTVISLTAINDLMFDRFLVHKVLVIGPLRVARDTWPMEVEKWDHLSDLKVSVAIGSEKVRLKALKEQADIYIINRENVQWLVEKSNIPFDFDMVVIDELSSFKNANSKRFKSMMKVRPMVKRIVGLTGTPTSNGLMDLFAEYKILDMGKRLGRYISHYRTKYFNPGWSNGAVVYTYVPIPGADKLIYDKIKDITISMKSVDYLDMPDKVISEYPVYLDSYEQEDYETLKHEFTVDLMDERGQIEITAANAGVLSGKLAQLSNGAIYTEKGDTIEFHRKKLDALEDIIEAMQGKPILLAYWFQHDYKRIVERLDSLGVKYRKLDSSQSIRDWNNKKLEVGLIHPASAGHGLNLQEGGNTIVWFGLTWSLELYQQTNARLWRQGQKSDTVVIQHIVTHGAIDELILKALNNKDLTQAALIDAVKAEIGGKRK